MNGITNKWHSLTADELTIVVNSPKNSGIKGSIITFVIVMVNILPVFFRSPLKFTKAYFNALFNGFIKG